MTAAEKAEELFVKFYPTWLDNGSVVKKKYAKEYSKLAVDEIIKSLEDYGRSTDELQNMEREFSWWERIKTEIEKL